MHDQRALLENRLERFVRDHLKPAVYRAAAPVTVTGWDAPGEPVPFAEAVEQTYDPVEIGSTWGRPWGTTWLHVTGQIPASWLASGRLPDGTSAEVVVDLGFAAGPGFQAEGLAYRADGTIIKAVSPLNHYLPLDPATPVDLYVEAAANPDVAHSDFEPTPYGDLATAGSAPLYTLRRLDIGLRDECVWELVQDVFTLDGLMRELPEHQPRRAELLQALSRMVDVVDPGDVAGTAAAGRAELAEVLARPAYASAHRIVAVGHAHIDSAWLWPVRETIRKCARTFSNVVALADADPTFKFACSSAQQYAWVKEHYPDAVRPDHREGGRGSVPAGRRDVGRVGHQHARRRGDGAAVRGRASGSSSRTSGWRPRRSGCPIRSATPPRCRRSPRRRDRSTS